MSSEISKERAGSSISSSGLQHPPGRRFVGRGRELEELKGAVEETLAGRGRVVLISGDPGIGKTRLAEEIASYGMRRGAK